MELRARNLSDIIDIIFVSDHGMADMTSAEVVYLEDIIGEEGVKQVEHFDGKRNISSPLHTLASSNSFTLYRLAFSRPSLLIEGKRLTVHLSPTQRLEGFQSSQI